MAAFRDRFERWWQDEPAAHAERMQRGLDRLAGQTNLDDELTRLAGFFGVDAAAEAPASVHVVSAPGPVASTTHAELRGARAYVETPLGEWPSMRIGVVAHELAHYYYALADAELRHATRDWFLANDSPFSVPAYNLFNEAIAAAFGAGIIDRRLQSERQFDRYSALPESFYADPYVDAAGKAILPLLSDYLDASRPLDRAFVDQYVTALDERLGRRVTDLAVWLRTMTLTSVSRGLSGYAPLVQRNLITGALFEERADGGCERPCLLQIYPDMSGIVLTLNEDVERLAEFVPVETVASIRRRTMTRPQSVFGHQRSDKSLLFVVAGESPDQVAEGLQRLLNHGVIFSGPLSP